ncbi:MAG: dihydroxy-acid dehydratase [Clostridia bacterium]
MRNKITLLRDGDNIDISINKGRISVDIKANEKQNRLKTADIFSQGSASKYLRAYAKTVGSPSEGCVIK